MKHRDDLVEAVVRLRVMFGRWARKIISEQDIDLTFEQTMILFILRDNEGMNIRDLALETDRDSTTTSRMTDGLEKRNLLVKVADRQDSRQKTLHLTRLGHETLEYLDHFKQGFISVLFDGVDEESIQQANGTLRKMMENIS